MCIRDSCGTTVHATNGNNLQQPDMFRHILERYPVKAVLAGHKHFATAAMLPGGTPAYTCRLYTSRCV